MSQPDDSPKGDPWRAFGYIVAGVAFYGFLGWLADRWLDTHFLVAIGVVLGAALGIYMTVARFTPDDAAPQNPTDTHSQDTE
ncbi:AtpZ/AtpI family protein [Nocardioides sp. YIM 152588]|uniref:AtpZ/AtpI family protein n=1 Tax=Nocardioides sp. YIM 152588 TaxID=3158259 RepID=UPI0032E3FEB4